MSKPSAENQNGLVQPLDITIAELSALRGSRDNTWRKIAAMDKYQGIPAGTLCAILKHGREPKKPEHRRILGLPPVAVSVEPCPTCNEVHTVPYCTKEYGEPDKNYPDEIAYLWQRVQDAERFSDAAHAYAEKLLKELEQKKESKPSINRKRQPRPRLSIHSEYPENAALTITTKKGNDRLYIERLRDYLSEYLEEKCKAETK